MRRLALIGAVFLSANMLLSACFSDGTALLAVNDEELTRVLALTPIAIATRPPTQEPLALPTELSRPTVPPPESVILNWKLDAAETLAYRAALEQPADYAAQISVDWGAFLAGNLDIDRTLAQTEALTVPNETSSVALLRPNAETNQIELRLILDDVTVAADLAEATPDPAAPPVTNTGRLQTAFGVRDAAQIGTVQLRGALRPDGAIGSFYQPRMERNWVAILFQLPAQPVRVGDSWTLDFTCLSADANTTIDYADRLHRVELRAINTTATNERIAVVDYLIVEALSGVTAQGTFFSERCAYVATGQFNVTTGRWQQLVGEFSRTALGADLLNVSYRVALTPTDTVPEGYADLP